MFEVIFCLFRSAGGASRPVCKERWRSRPFEFWICSTTAQSPHELQTTSVTNELHYKEYLS